MSSAPQGDTNPKGTNIVWHEASVDRQSRAQQRGHR
ncbi:MAG: adenylyl-sulfate kinase, partial [Cyanobacteriota bacterium]|nr:adenylyl-sulfate kinase [Cyanobacteriota bacterium]